jgi:hypothetical protein
MVTGSSSNASVAAFVVVASLVGVLEADGVAGTVVGCVVFLVTDGVAGAVEAGAPVFTRCDVVDTWSREYQLSSSSYSHSYSHSYSYSNSNSYSPDDSLFFGFSQMSRNF